MRYFLLLGGNEGDVDETMQRAIERIGEVGEVIKESGTYESEAWGYESALRYHNKAVEIESKVEPEEMLRFVKEVEVSLGRRLRKVGEGYSDRPIDIDIIFCDDRVIESEELVVPHPRMHLRRFVLEPMAEICGEKRHPVLGSTVKELLNGILREEGAN